MTRHSLAPKVPIAAERTMPMLRRDVVLGAILVASVALNIGLIVRATRDTPAGAPVTQSGLTTRLPGGVGTPTTAVPLPIGATMGIGTLKVAVERVFAISAPNASRTWLGVEGTVENGGLENAPLVAAQHFVVKDSSGNQYHISIDAMQEARELGLSKRQEWTADIAPSQVIKGFVAFDLPSDCSGMTFVVVGQAREASWLLDAVCGAATSDSSRRLLPPGHAIPATFTVLGSDVAMPPTRPGTWQPLPTSMPRPALRSDSRYGSPPWPDMLPGRRAQPLLT